MGKVRRFRTCLHPRGWKVGECRDDGEVWAIFASCVVCGEWYMAEPPLVDR